MSEFRERCNQFGWQQGPGSSPRYSSFTSADFAKFRWRKQWEIRILTCLILASCALLSSMSYASSASATRSGKTTGFCSSYETDRSSMSGNGEIWRSQQMPKGKGKGKKGQVDHHPERDPRISRNTQLLLGPQFKPSKVVCACCGEPGHHVQNCVKAIESRNARAAVDCVRGRHYPYLHGVWRCNWCGMHLHDEDVKRQCPRLYAREAARDADKHEKYGSPFTQWQ